jgi:hypothetical protein
LAHCVVVESSVWRARGGRWLPGVVTTLLVSPVSLSCADPGGQQPPEGAAGMTSGAAGSASGAAGGGGMAQTLDPGRKDMHRLNTAEYNATVADVLGTTLQPATSNWRGGELTGFDNMASVLGVDEAQYERYFNAAKALATEVLAADELRARFLSCDAGESACVRATIETAGLRLFRRPLAADEISTYERVHAAALALGGAPLSALELTFQALLSSAEFIYRVELDPDPQSTDAHPLSSFELASRLSYFFWSSAPDDALLRAAAEDSLKDPGTLAAVVDRMLGDPKSERFIAHFAGQWLGARQVLAHPVAPGIYWPEEVARAASDEMLLYFSEFVRSERSWFEFPLADVNYVNDYLALFYGNGMPSVQVTTRVEHKGDRRAGFFGLVGFLALSSYDRRTSPSLRGRWIASNMLCNSPDEPPPDVPKLEAGGSDPSKLNIRQIMEQHSQNPACAGCHALFDHYGFALEEYDAVGQYRTTYADGTPVDASAVLPPSDAHPDGLSFTGLEGLARVVAEDPQFGRCLAEKLLTYALGRPVAESDQPYLEQAQREWLAPDQVPSIRRLIHLLVATEAFRFRRGESKLTDQP